MYQKPILTIKEVERIKWQYSGATQVENLIESHECLRELAKDKLPVDNSTDRIKGPKEL